MSFTRSHRIIAGVLVAAVAASAVVPAAFAGSYRQGGVATRGYVVERNSSSSVVPAIAGFIGGVALGTILSNHDNSVGVDAQAVCDNGGYRGGRVYRRDRGEYRGGDGGAYYGGGVSYNSGGYYGGGYGGGDNCNNAGVYYVDPWNGQQFSSLAEYRSECRGHTPIAQVIDARSGQCVRTVCWHDGGWHNYDTSDPPWQHDRNRGRGYDRGYGWNGGY